MLVVKFLNSADEEHNKSRSIISGEVKAEVNT